MPAVVTTLSRSAAGIGWHPWRIIGRLLHVLEQLNRAAEPRHSDLPSEFYKYPPV